MSNTGNTCACTPEGGMLFPFLCAWVIFEVPIYVLCTSEVVRIIVTRPKQAYMGNNTPLARDMEIVSKAGYALIVSPVGRCFAMSTRFRRPILNTTSHGGRDNVSSL